MHLPIVAITVYNKLYLSPFPLLLYIKKKKKSMQVIKKHHHKSLLSSIQLLALTNDLDVLIIKEKKKRKY